MPHKFYTIEQIDFLVDNFQNRKLLKEDWTHESHLIVAVWHIYNYDFFEALCRLKSGIILLNSSHKTENSSSTGYHETLTIFWSRIIFEFIKLNDSLPFETIMNKFLNSTLADRKLPFEFYNKSELLSAKFRSVYMEPTHKNFDKLALTEIIKRSCTQDL